MIDEQALLAEAGERIFARGVGYFQSDAVTDLIVSGGAIHAQVIGSDDYAVRLRTAGDALDFSCTCPMGEEGALCKHVVAVGLAWLERAGGASPEDEEDELADVRAWLAAAPRQVLEEIVIDQALEDSALRSRLEMRAERAKAARNPDLKALKATVSKALGVRGFVDYHGMRSVIRRAMHVEDLIAGLLDDGHATVAYELASHALKRGIASYTRLDDSGGGFGDLLRGIAALHLKTTRAAMPQPTALGKTLFDLLLRDEWGLLRLSDYAPLLGEKGLRALSRRAEKEWEKVPARGPGEDSVHSDVAHFQITALMEALARQRGDVDALVAIKSRNLTSPYQFLQIAELLAEADRHDEALDWAERGQKGFADKSDWRLVEFLTDEYARRDRHDQAVALAWDAFVHEPKLLTYERLKLCAERGELWQHWRTKALDWVRGDYLPALKRQRSRWRWAPGGHSLLVEIFLWEGDVDAAFAEARTGGCTVSLWFKLAKALEKRRPAEAAAIYRNRIDDIVNHKNNDAYDEAADLAVKIRGLMQRTKDEAAFDEWIADVRKRHKPKRNFIKRLDERGLTGTR